MGTVEQKDRKMKTASYTFELCKHNNLEKVGMNLYFCNDCGKVLSIVMTLQFEYEEALKYFGNNFIGLQGYGKKIREAQKKEEKREEEADKKVTEDLKKEEERKMKEVKDGGNNKVN